jgi:hypothetical protein
VPHRAHVDSICVYAEISIRRDCAFAARGELCLLGIRIAWTGDRGVAYRLMVDSPLSFSLTSATSAEGEIGLTT